MLSPSAWRTAWSEMASTNGCTKGAGTPWGRAASHMDLIPHETASDTEQPIFVLTETSHLIQHLRCNSSARFPPCRKLCAWPPYNKWPGAILRLESWQAEDGQRHRSFEVRSRVQPPESCAYRCRFNTFFSKSFLIILSILSIWSIFSVLICCFCLIYLTYSSYLSYLSYLSYVSYLSYLIYILYLVYHIYVIYFFLPYLHYWSYRSFLSNPSYLSYQFYIQYLICLIQSI